MKQNTQKQKIARLEFVNDQLETEIGYLDNLLKLVGFTEGLISVKQAAAEVIEGEKNKEDGQEER